MPAPQWSAPIGTLRSKFLLSLTLITALITFAVLLLVQYRVRLHVRTEIAQALRDSVVTFQNLQRQRETMLARSTALIATLPPLKALMTSQDRATIEDASTMFWELAGSQVFVLADRTGRVAALHANAGNFTPSAAEAAIRRYLGSADSRGWWYGDGHLFELFFEPIYFGSPESGHPIGILGVGYEIDAGVAGDVTRIAAGGVGFGYEKNLVISTMPAQQHAALARYVSQVADSDGQPTEIRLGDERFLATSIRLSSTDQQLVTLTFLKSFDAATAFLQNLNRWIVAVGLGGVVAGSLLVFFVSTTYTRPLGRLVAGVQALEKGDFAYPLDLDGRDEVSALTRAFGRMRETLQETQQRLLDSERLATIGRMASTISHDLRHPLTAIQAYAEFLSERELNEAQRKDFYQEIRIAVNGMMDEINSLLGFSRQSEALHPSHTRLDVIIDRAIKTVKALPEYERIAITFTGDGQCVAWCDAAKIERAILNLLFNAAEAVPAESGRIDVTCTGSDRGVEIRVADNGPGIPEAIRCRLFEPFVSHGKEKGIGLGLTVVRSIMQQHHGEASVERTDVHGTVFRLFVPVTGNPER